MVGIFCKGSGVIHNRNEDSDVVMILWLSWLDIGRLGTLAYREKHPRRN